MNKEQILALAEKADKTATQYLQCAGEYHPDYHSVRDEHFYHAAIESYKAELLKEVQGVQPELGEPIYQVCKSDSISLSSAWIDVTEQTYNDAGLYPEYGRRILYTSDQLATAILKATKLLEDQLAKAEQQAKELSDSVAQKVAEACALQVATETRFHWLDAARVAKEIRSGEWRKFVKEV